MTSQAGSGVGVAPLRRFHQVCSRFCTQTSAEVAFAIASTRRFGMVT